MTQATHVEILVNGRPVRQYTHNNNRFIEARAGTEYTIKIKSGAYCRKLAVVTVDGVNVITGQPQDNDIGQGYIVDICGAIEVKGFRKDTDTVGAFKFCGKSKSYCNEKGLKGNNGVIGVRLYDEDARAVLIRGLDKYYTTPDPEKTPWTVTPTIPDIRFTNDYVVNCSVDPNPKATEDVNYCCSTASSPDFDLGTTWGSKVKDSIVYTDFDVNKTSFTDFVIYYDTKENLKKIGIAFDNEKQVYFPKPFGAFATPPKNWRG